MFDRRIVRGNTYAREDVLPVTAQVLYSGFLGRLSTLLVVKLEFRNIRLIYKERLKRDVLVKLENVSQN